MLLSLLALAVGRLPWLFYIVGTRGYAMSQSQSQLRKTVLSKNPKQTLGLPFPVLLIQTGVIVYGHGLNVRWFINQAKTAGKTVRLVDGACEIYS